MIRNELFQRILSIQRSIFAQKCSNLSSQINIEKLESESTDVEVYDEELIRREEEIERKRNKSRLKEQDRNILFDKNPYPEPQFWYHGTLKYSRKMYGKYGKASGVDPALCWPTKQELQERLEYEQIAFPKTIPQMAEEARVKRKQKHEDILKRQADIVAKVAKLEQWKKELEQRIASKESEANEAKARKERLIEEVRMHFGYSVDPKDEKFQQMLEKKEKEQKKAMKEARKKAKEEKYAQRLKKNTEGDNEGSTEKSAEGTDSTEVSK